MSQQILIVHLKIVPESTPTNLKPSCVRHILFLDIAITIKSVDLLMGIQSWFHSPLNKSSRRGNAMAFGERGIAVTASDVNLDMPK